jgi:hypothetical protein
MKTILSALSLLAIFATMQPQDAHARAGTLISCEGISTNQGYKYVGIYCADHQCRYTITSVFNSYCPFSI